MTETTKRPGLPNSADPMNSGGFTLIEVMVAGFLAVTLGTGLLSVFNFASRSSANESFRVSLASVRANLLAQLTQQQAWANTVQDPTNQAVSFACLNSGACPAIGAAFRILDVSNQVIFDPATPGLTDQAVPCKGFPSATCQNQIALSWAPISVLSDPAQLQVNVALQSSQFTQHATEAAHFTFSVVRNYQEPTLLSLSSGSVANAINLFQLAGSPIQPLTVIYTVDSGAVITSPSAAQPALTIGPFPAGSKVHIVNRGTIIGAGGPGGNGAPSGRCGCNAGGAGGVGGPAVDATTVPIKVENYGIIAGGGGGGGGGGSECARKPPWDASAGGGGGGAGFGAGGLANGCGVNFVLPPRYGKNGGEGTTTAGGAAGGAGNSPNTCDGGAGGNPGQPGAPGLTCTAPRGGRGLARPGDPGGG